MWINLRLNEKYLHLLNKFQICPIVKMEGAKQENLEEVVSFFLIVCVTDIFRLTCSHPELTEDHVLTSAFVKIFRTVTRNAVNKSV